VFTWTQVVQQPSPVCAHTVGDALAVLPLAAENLQVSDPSPPRRVQDDNRAGERVAVDTRKQNSADFALWKVRQCVEGQG
jgi:hypothetical protein